MAIKCECGQILRDNTDNLAWRAHFILDQQWNDLWDDIDDAIERPPANATPDQLCMKLRQSHTARNVWQCYQCGRLLIEDDEHRLHVFTPASPMTPKELFRFK